MKELIIEEYIFRTVILLLDGKPVYLRVTELPDDLRSGDIYHGIVKSTSLRTGSVFIDIGRKRQAFMQVPKGKPLPGTGDRLLVEVLREEEGRKGARVTDDISIATSEMVVRKGRGKSFSKNASSTIPEVLKKHLPEYIGVNMLYRKSVTHMPIENILKKAEELKDKFLKLMGKSNTFTEPGPVLRGESPLLDLIRNNEDELIDIITNSPSVYEKIRDDFPHLSASLTGESPIDLKNLRNFTDRLRRKTVSLPSGGNIVIEETESLTAVDVNSSSLGKKGKIDARRTNIEALEELKIQMDLRNISGVIVIDFIEIHEERLKDELYFKAKELFNNARPKVTVYPLTELSLMQLTRRREGKPLSETIFRRDTDKKLTVNPAYLYEILFIRLKSLRIELKGKDGENILQETTACKIPVDISVNSLYESHLTDKYILMLRNEFEDFDLNITYGTDCDLYKLTRGFLRLKED